MSSDTNMILPRIAIIIFTILILSGNAMGYYDNRKDDLTFAMSIALITLLGIGIIFNYFGWKIYHIFVSLMGFIFLGIIGGFIGGSALGRWESALVFFILCGIGGWILAPMIEKAFILISSFIMGFIFSFIILRIYMGLPSDAPTGLIILIISILYAGICWKLYKFFIILTMCIIGTIMMIYALQGMPISRFVFPLSLMLLFSGILIQYKKLTGISLFEILQKPSENKTKYKLFIVVAGILFFTIGLFFFASSIADYIFANNLAYWNIYRDWYLRTFILNKMDNELGWGILFIFFGNFLFYAAQIKYNKFDFLSGTLFFISSLIYNNINNFFPSESPIPATNEKMAISLEIYKFFNTNFPSSPRNTFEYLSYIIIILSLIMLLISYYSKKRALIPK